MTEGTVRPNEQEACVQEDIDQADVLRMIEKHDEGRGGLIAILGDIQTEYGYLPEEALRTLSDKMDCSLVDVYGMATFYRSFSLEPRGKHLISVCLGTACHVRGAPRVVEEFCRQLGIQAGETTADKEFTLETANCLGACALGPTVVIDGRYFSKVRRTMVEQLLRKAQSEFDEAEGVEGDGFVHVEVSCPRCNHTLMDSAFVIDDHPSIRVRAAFDQKEGWLRFSSLYGSHSVLAEHGIPVGKVISLSCPHCRRELTGSWECVMCGAVMAPMLVSGGGTMLVCSRHGCSGHMLDLG